MEQHKEINIAIKFAEIDNRPFSAEQEGWVSGFVRMLEQTLVFYFKRPIVFRFIKETEIITEKDFNNLDAILYILSPAFVLSSNIEADVSMMEKVSLFNTDYINAKVYKVLKGPVKISELPMTISMGRYYYFYQNSSTEDSLYDTLYEWDSSPMVRGKYWDSLTSLLFDLLKPMGHENHERFMPATDQTVFLGNGDLGQLWNRNRLLGELNSRGLNILPDHDHSLEVKHLNEPVKFYLRKSDLAIHFPEEFLPMNDKSLQDLADMPELKRFIWFDPEAGKDLVRKMQYDELKLQLKNLNHVEAINAGLEELKEIIFAAGQLIKREEEEKEHQELRSIYLICADYFGRDQKMELVTLLQKLNMNLLLQGPESGNEKRASHNQHLKKANYALICYDGRSVDWIRANINEVRKAAGLHNDTKGRIKLGIFLPSANIPDELTAYAQGITFISALSPSLAEDLNDYVNEN